MPVSGLVVSTKKGKAPAVAERLRALDRVQVTDLLRDSLVLVTETDSREADKALWSMLESVEDLVELSLIYHNFEDLGDGSDPGLCGEERA